MQLGYTSEQDRLQTDKDSIVQHTLDEENVSDDDDASSIESLDYNSFS